MSNTSIVIILSDSSHRFIGCTGKMEHKEIVRRVRAQNKISHPCYILMVIVAVGSKVTTYEGSDVDELMTGSHTILINDQPQRR